MRTIITFFFILLFFTGNIQCQQKGKLSISSDGHTFEYADGTPFFWLGDTAWELFHGLNKEETDYYLETRKSQGYNVIQAVILSELNGLTESNRFGELPLTDKDPNKPNEAFFENIDYVIKKAASLDMYIALLPTWGRYWSEDPIFTSKNAYTYGKYLGERYKNQWNIIWVLGGDRIPKTNEQYKIINQMALGLEDGDKKKHLKTFHPSGNNTSLSFFQNKSWIDFHMAQSGHAHRDEPNYLYTLNNNIAKPTKPFIDGEPRYEDLPVKFWEIKLENGYQENAYPIADSLTPHGYFNAYDVRRAAYWSVFSGAAGATYGNGSVWCFWQEGRYAPIAVKHSWQRSMESPGGKQMIFLKKLIEAYGINNLTPNRSFIADNWSNATNYQAVISTKDNKSVLIYIPEGNPIKISKVKIAKGNIFYRWYNPRNGQFSKKQLIKETTDLILNFKPPSQGNGNDWILVIDSKQ